MKKLMTSFLAEWLIKYGTNPTDGHALDLDHLGLPIKATRKGYLTAEVQGGRLVALKLTKEGIQYLQENQK